MFKKIFLITAVLLVLSGCLQQPETSFPDFMEGDESEPYEFEPVFDQLIPAEEAPIPGNCENLQLQVDKDICLFLTALEDSSTTSCLEISELWQKNNCISAVASENLAIEPCSLMESAYSSDNTNVKNSCIAEVALGVLYTEKCANLEGRAWEADCWNEAISVCRESSSNDWEELCIKKLAIYTGDNEQCLLLHGFEKDTCLEEIAVAFQNQDICLPIEDSTIMGTCLERTQQGTFRDFELSAEGCESMGGRTVAFSLGCDAEEEDYGEIAESVPPQICCLIESEEFEIA